MKKIILVLSVIFYSLAISGQDYHKLINESFYWDVPIAEMGYICEGYGDTGPFRYIFSGDTLINNETYSKIYYASFINLNPPPSANCPPFAIDTNFILLPNCFLREDSVEKKVWRYMTLNEPEEILLFDFSVEQGDTIEYSGFPDAIIDTIYNIITNDGVSRKRFEFGDQGSFPGGFFIEGLGGAGGLLEIPYYYFEGGAWLMCVKDSNNNNLWGSSVNCFDFIASTPHHELSNFMEIYPNPTKDWLYFKQPNLGSIYNFEIRNLFGQIVKEVKNIKNSHYSLNVSNLKAGVYFYVIKQQNEILQQGKLIVK